jgi:DNA-binding beta-propeller fold protein YncE
MSKLGAVLLGVVALAVAGCNNTCVEKSGNACAWAGTGELGFNGDGKSRLESRLYWPIDMEFAPDGVPWVLDWNNHKIRKVVDDKFQTVVGDFLGDGPPDESDLVAPGAPALEVRLNHPTDIQFEPDGTLTFAAWHNHKLRHMDANGNVLVICGRGGGFAGDGKPVAGALFNQPKAIVRTPEGAVYILDQRNFRIRKIAAGANPIITTVVGTGVAGFGGDNGPPLMAQLKFEAGGNPEPSGALALDASGNLYISDGLNHRIRKVDFAADKITTIAGTGEAGFSGDGAAATSAQINNARDLEFGPDGRLYVADTENNRVRAIDLTTGVIDTVVGSGEAGTRPAEYVGKPVDGLLATNIELNRPFGIAFDKDGNLFVSDSFNSRIVKVTK